MPNHFIIKFDVLVDEKKIETRQLGSTSPDTNPMVETVISTATKYYRKKYPNSSVEIKVTEVQPVTADEYYKETNNFLDLGNS